MCFMHNIQKMQISRREEASSLTGEPAPGAAVVCPPPTPTRPSSGGSWSRSPFSSNQHEARFTLTAACCYPSVIN